MTITDKNKFYVVNLGHSYQEILSSGESELCYVSPTKWMRFDAYQTLDDALIAYDILTSKTIEIRSWQDVELEEVTLDAQTNEYAYKTIKTTEEE